MWDSARVPHTTGLREAKKQQTRAALAAAAERLATTRGGMVQVTVEDIAAEAGVSPRTFFNYFASKEEAFLCDDFERGERFLDALRAAPDTDDLWQLILDKVLDQFLEGGMPPRERMQQRHQLLADPDVLKLKLETMTRLEAAMTVEVARRLDEEPTALYPRLMVAAAAAALRSAGEAWLADPDADIEETVRQAFSTLAPCFAAGPAALPH